MPPKAQIRLGALIGMLAAVAAFSASTYVAAVLTDRAIRIEMQADVERAAESRRLLLEVEAKEFHE